MTALKRGSLRTTLGATPVATFDKSQRPSIRGPRSLYQQQTRYDQRAGSHGRLAAHLELTTAYTVHGAAT